MLKLLTVSLLASVGMAVLPLAWAQDPAGAAPGVLSARKQVVFAADVFFDVDQSVLRPAAQEKLDILVEQMKALDLQKVYVTGHADARASDPYNLRLSAERSRAVRDYLLGKGIDPQHVQIAARGKAQPVADNRTREGRSQNRRVEIEVIGMRR
jgi:OmpA-OmpF porin, OOP family